MRKLSLLTATIITLVCLTSLVGCGTQRDSFYLSAFGSPVHVEVYEKALTNEVKQEIQNELSKLEGEFSVNVPSSMVCKINSATSCQLSERAEEVISLAKECYQFSSGKFNPAVYPLNKLWHFAKSTEVKREDFTPPTKLEIDAILESGALDFGKLTVENGTLNMENENIEIDLGGILKGYATNKLLEILSKNGYDKGYVSLGTSSMVLIKMEKLAVRHPQNGLENLLEINCDATKNISISTSGNYEKYYDFEGKRYSHIIDPMSGEPYSTGIISATVLCSDGAFADAMTTALCLCSVNEENYQSSELVSFINKIITKDECASVYAVYSKGDKKIIITNKKQGVDFTLLDNSFNVVEV